MYYALEPPTFSKGRSFLKHFYLQNVYAVDLSQLNNVLADDTPRISAASLSQNSNATNRCSLPSNSGQTTINYHFNCSPTKSQLSVRKPGESTMNNSLNGDNQIKMIDEED